LAGTDPLIAANPPHAKIVAHPVDRKLIGVKVEQLKDADGNQYGLDTIFPIG
jgi:hypothetical protein